MQKIFLDTNIIFSLIYFMKKTNSLPNRFYYNTRGNLLIVSKYVIYELEQLFTKLGIDKVLLRKYLEVLIKYLDIYIYESKSLKEEYLKYVFDEDDAQILQDAVESKSDILLTNNLKDFKIELIEKDFKIKITDKLEN